MPPQPKLPIDVPEVPSELSSELASNLPGTAADATCPPLDDHLRFPSDWVFREHTGRRQESGKVDVLKHDTHLQPLDEQLPAIDNFTTETDGALEPCGVVHVARTHAGDTTFNLVVVSPRYRFSR